MDLTDNASNFIRLTDDEFNYIVSFVSGRYGIDLSQKRKLIEARLASELKARGFKTYEEYIAMMKANPGAIDGFLNKITTNYSYFNREMEHYDFLMKTIIPELMARKKSSVSIWSAGCSTGEEPYNIAMAIDSALGIKRNLWNVSITATDVSTRALTAARQAEYPDSELGSMPPEWVKNYMTKLPNGNYQVNPNIRRVVTFSQFNLMDPFPPRTYDVIFCRNVMIYFKQATSQAVINKFYDRTHEGGYLFIGHSESISHSDNPYQYVKPSIFHKVVK